MLIFMTVGKYLTKIAFQCKCVFIFIFLTIIKGNFLRHVLGGQGVDALHCCILRKFNGDMYAR